MKVREVAALLKLLEKHPRVASLTVADVVVTFHASTPEVAAAEPAQDATGDGGDESPVDPDAELELPSGVLDVAAKMRAINRKYGRDQAAARGRAS